VPPTIAFRLVQQTSFDSGVPSGTAVIAHPVATTGSFTISIIKGAEEVVRRRSLIVGPAPGARAASGAVSVDLVVPAVATADLEAPLEVAAGGWATFSASSGDGAAVRITDAQGGTEFDSRRLGAGDLFAVTLVRPGRYRVTETGSGITLDARVTYPRPGPTPYRPADPQRVHFAAGFDPATVELGPGQGLVVEVGEVAHMVVELIEPDDGPAPDDRARRPRWSRR
jgi:hypothetical protein